MAANDTLVVFTPSNNEPPTSSTVNPATLDTRGGAAGAQHLVLDFDASSQESAEFGAFIPRHSSTTPGIVATVGWIASTATSGNCVWAVQFKSVTDDADDLDTKAFASAQSVTAAAPSAAGEVSYDTITFTNGQADSVNKAEYFRLRISRSATATTDTMAGDAELLFCELREAT